jgi:RNA polymerase sigma-70 factor (ECF subfamily)
MMALPSDEFLLRCFANGDADAFDRLAARYCDVLDGYFRRRLPDDGRVEELRQETLLALYSILPSYRERGRFRALVFSIAYRKLASALRAQRPTVPLTDDPGARVSGDRDMEVRFAVQALPEPLREAINLTRFEGMTAEEAGEVLGCSAEAVRARVCRAKSLLAEALQTGIRRKR